MQKSPVEKETRASGKDSQGLCSSELWNSNGNVWVTDEAAPVITPLIAGQNRGLFPFMINTACWMPSSPRILCTLGIPILFLFKVVKLSSFNQANSLEVASETWSSRRKDPILVLMVLSCHSSDPYFQGNLLSFNYIPHTPYAKLTSTFNIPAMPYVAARRGTTRICLPENLRRGR